MQSDTKLLTSINIGIGDAENKGDKRKLDEEYLASRLAFRRADRKTTDDRCEFLDKVAESPERETEIREIKIYGDRAVVECVVTLKKTTGDEKFHNLRLFVREGGVWKLLGWANEPL